MHRDSLSTCAEFHLLLFSPRVSDAVSTLREKLSTLPTTTAIELSYGAVLDATIGDSVGTQQVLPDIIVTLKSADPLPMLNELRIILDAIEGLVDGSACRVLGTRSYEILAGWGPVRIYYGLHRLPDMTREDFCRYWLGHHADIGRRLIPPYSYFQSHADETLNKIASAQCTLDISPLDGIVNVHFPNLAAAQEQLANEKVATEALEDEKKFIDHNRVQFGLYQCERL